MKEACLLAHSLVHVHGSSFWFMDFLIKKV